MVDGVVNPTGHPIASIRIRRRGRYFTQHTSRLPEIDDLILRLQYPMRGHVEVFPITKVRRSTG